MCNLFIPNYIVSLFKDELNSIMESLLKNIASDYNLDVNELKKKYMIDINVIDNNEQKLEIIKKHKYNRNKNTQDKCFAYSSKGEQCQKTKQAGEQFCFIHLHERKYGTLTQKVDLKSTKTLKYY
jgi:hypothetical protein